MILYKCFVDWVLIEINGRECDLFLSGLCFMYFINFLFLKNFEIMKS